jgi:hypothetical protein
MGRWAARLAALLALLPASSSAGQTVVSFTTHGAAVALTEAEQAPIAERVRTLMVGCAITSVSEPGLFEGRDLAKEWANVRSRSHLYVRFPEPVQTERGAVRFLEVAISFEEPNFIGLELTRNGDEVVGHVKCSGQHSLALMCTTALRERLSAGQERACTVYDRLVEPK